MPREPFAQPVGQVTLPARNYGPLHALWLRALLALACLVITTLVVWFGRDGYRDLDGKLTDIWSCLYYATVSLSTTGYGDITPVTTRARMVNVLVITPLRLVFLVTLVGTTVEVLTSRGRAQLRRNRWRERVRDHTVIIGFGVKGRTAAETLISGGMSPSDIVVVAEDPLSCAEASDLGMVTVRGDARRDDVLRSASIETARSLIVATDSDDITTLVILSARRINPRLTITAAARESENAVLMRESGAESVIMTAESAGQMLAIAQVSPTAGKILEDLIDPSEGMEVVERKVLPAEYGLKPSKLTERGLLVLSVIRDGRSHRFDSADITVLEKDDLLVFIQHKEPPAKGA